jgi:nicotinamidase-related amidase
VAGHGNPTRKKPGHGILEQHRRTRAALLLIDVINDLEFPGSEALVRQAVPMARRIARLKARAVTRGLPVIYVNDNFGQWRSDFRSLVEYCTSADVAGREVADMLRPGPDDYFVLKPKHSAFFQTTLDLLLESLGAETLILTGLAGNICVLFTANDAYMRNFEIVVPEDCIASNSPADNRAALRQMRDLMDADTTPSPRLRLRKFVRQGRRRGAPAR